MTLRTALILACVGWCWCAGLVTPCVRAAPATTQSGGELVYVDDGVIRWTADGREVVLFGVNYCLPSACDYRAAGYVGADRKQLIDQDMAHLARMGFDGLRISFWGDWENSDAKGNLIANDHLDLMDYMIAQATRRGMYMLFSPIVTYSSLWPDLKDDKSVVGFSRHFEKSELGTNPEAIAAQQNYLRQILKHVNPYTSRAIKDEPNILFVEMINEPWHHSKDVGGSIKYIDALVQAVRDTGCRKLTFHNLSQDFGMARPIGESSVDGFTFGWYPSALLAGHELHGNFLPFVADYPPLGRPDIPHKPRLVYEFDLADTNTGYAYPAMARAFRQYGAQFAAMFSYDMLATAPYNLGWQTHLLNLVCTPKKAASAVIAGEAMHRLPRGASYGAYPDGDRFGEFRVSYADDLAELVTQDCFLYSNTTKTTPPSPQSLTRVVGVGSSAIVQYDGLGIYFLDRIDAGRWRLEVYPDVVQVDDPFQKPDKNKLRIRTIRRRNAMTVRLPELEGAFTVRGLDAGNAEQSTANDGRFAVLPGVYLLTAPDRAVDGPPPERIGRVALREFVCPPQGVAPPRVASTMPMHHAGPSTTAVANRAAAEITLFDAARDADRLATSRQGWAPHPLVAGEKPDERAVRLGYASQATWTPEDLTRSLYVGDYDAQRGSSAGRATLLVVKLRTKTDGSVVHVTLVDKDGAAWSAPVKGSAEWSEVRVPLTQFKPSKWVLLPQGFPNELKYFSSLDGKPAIDVPALERLQFSLRKADLGNIAPDDVAVDVARVSLRFTEP